MFRTKLNKMAPKLATNPKASLVGWGFVVGSLVGWGFVVGCGTLLHSLPSQQSSEQSVTMPVELTSLQVLI